MKAPFRPVRLPESLHHRLNLYAIAAAGVGACTLAVPAAHAKIVYTKTNEQIPLCNTFDLDLNHDGVRDFAFYHCSSGQAGGVELSSTSRQVNVVWGQKGFASALNLGFKIGPNKNHFQPKQNGMAFWGCTVYYNQTCTTHGPWSNVSRRYLGLKFQINGQFHYGWARLNVKNYKGITATITGYAYETVPNKPILAGATKEVKQMPAESRTLGSLGRGAAALEK